MKIESLTVIKLFVLYFNHSPKIIEKMDFYKAKDTCCIKNFYFNVICTPSRFDWFILNMETGEAVIMNNGNFKLSNITTIKSLIRFIRIFRNAFIGSPYRDN